MDREQMLARTRTFAVRIIHLAAALPNGRVGDVLGRQVLKSGTSIGANYREAVRASSRRHFISTLEIVQREADETSYWLDLLVESQVMPPARLDELRRECNELLAIITATIRSAKQQPAKPTACTLKNQKSEIKNKNST